MTLLNCWPPILEIELSQESKLQKRDCSAESESVSIVDRFS